MKKPVLFILCAIVLAGGGWFAWHTHSTSKDKVVSVKTTSSGSASNTASGDGFDKNQYSLTDPSSLWIVVNKTRQLNPATYTPSNLVVPTIPLRSNITSTEKYVRSDMATALEKMVADAATQGVHFNLQSGYRSYNFQISLYNSYVQQQGKAVADSQSARPGFSEHQTGLAADLGGTSEPSCDVADCFSTTVEGKWLAANAYKYGFIIRYPADKVNITGYIYEPWHVRYIGTALSQEMHKDGIETLEEFFGLPAAPDYK